MQTISNLIIDIQAFSIISDLIIDIQAFSKGKFDMTFLAMSGGYSCMVTE